jgi:hypothetical protein
VTGTTAVDSGEAQRLRDAMTDKLVENGWITSASSGGYNAALLAEVTGPGGRVVSIDM